WQPAGGTARAAKQQLELQPGQAAEWHAVLGASNGHHLQGLLVDKNGRPLAGWSVLAHQRGQPSPATVSGSDGAFRLPLEKQRTVDLRAFAPGRRPRTFADAVLRELDSGATGVRFVAERGAFGSARGRVQLADGTGVPAEVRCWHQERGEYVALQAQDDGTLQLRELPAGTIDFELHHPGAVRALRSDVRIEAGGEVDFGIVELQPGASLRGAVRAADGSAIADARLQIVAKDAEFVADYDGRNYTFPALPAGTHRLQVQAPGHAAATFDLTVAAGQNQERDVVLAAGVRKRVLLQVPAGASGNVTLAFQPTGGTLTWRHTVSLPQRTTVPQTLEFVAWLAPGSYQAVAWCGSSLAAEQGVLFAADDEQPLTLSLQRR
ncbi:MAG: carboxypeptidase-like regulatory domain-containing protein, partial [Planctomycetota bacterium]